MKTRQTHTSKIKSFFERLDEPLGSVPDLEKQSHKVLIEFARLISEDPKLSYDLIFTTDKYKVQVVTLLAEFAIKLALHKQACTNNNELDAAKLQAECDNLKKRLPMLR